MSVRRPRRQRVAAFTADNEYGRHRLSALLLTHYFEPELGAPQRRWAAFARSFSERGIGLEVVAPLPHHPSGRFTDSSRAFDVRGGVKGEHGATVHRVRFLAHDGSMFRRTLDHVYVACLSFGRVRRLLRAGAIDPDVVIATAPALPTIFLGWLVARKLRVPYILEMRDAWPDLLSNTPGFSSSTRIRRLAKRCTANAITQVQRAADAVVVTSEHFAKSLRARGMQHVTVIRNGTSPDRYAIVAEARAGDRAEFAERCASVRALYMGTVGRSQGLEVVVRAAARLRAEGSDLQVRIVGHGADYSVLEKLNSALGAPVEMFPTVDRNAVLEHYRWANTCVTSLRDWVPFQMTVPSKLYELMATGKHVTALLSGEAASIVKRTQCGDVVKPGDEDALVVLWRGLSLEPSRLHVGSAGQQWVMRHADDRVLGMRFADLLEVVSNPAESH